MNQFCRTCREDVLRSTCQTIMRKTAVIKTRGAALTTFLINIIEHHRDISPYHHPIILVIFTSTFWFLYTANIKRPSHILLPCYSMWKGSFRSCAYFSCLNLLSISTWAAEFAHVFQRNIPFTATTHEERTITCVLNVIYRFPVERFINDVELIS